MGKKELDISRAAGGAHHQLGSLVGDWHGAARTWFEPDKLADESPIRGSMRAALDGRFVVHEYEGPLCGEPLQGMAIVGYHLDKQRFEMAWVDSAHMGTGIMFCESGPQPAEISVLGSYGAGSGPDWG